MTCGGYFEGDEKVKRISFLEEKMQDPSIWNGEDGELLVAELKNLKGDVHDLVSLKDHLNSLKETFSLLEEEYDEELFLLCLEEFHKEEKEYERLSLQLVFSHDYDHGDCILEVHSGAGGTEACDWAMMLFRMYQRYVSSKNYKIEILDYQDGDSAGIKRASFLVHGKNAYGYLKCEKGVHRLVRLSPFDANNKRHTSFASVDVTPVFKEVSDITLKDEDLKIDVYRSSGAGGQSVNTTDSAVRITHLPTKIVVTCQNERSQIKNKEKALEILKNKLKMMDILEKEKELALLKGESVATSFGSQIRSYVMHPYSMVKDHRTDVSTSNVSKVLDGDLDLFIDAYLRRQTNEK